MVSATSTYNNKKSHGPLPGAVAYNLKKVLKNKPALKDIIEGCARRDNKSEELLYKTFYGYLSGVIYRYVKQRNEMDALINDAFTRVFKKISSFNFNGPPEELPKAFKGWIGRIAANVAIDSIRSRKALLYIDDVADEQVMQIAVATQDTLSYQDIIQLIDMLPPIQQVIFNMHQIEGFSHDEIAERFSIPPSTSRVYLTRARAKLADLYQKSMMTYYGK